jgi:hypothetical protein
MEPRGSPNPLDQTRNVAGQPGNCAAIEHNKSSIRIGLARKCVALTPQYWWRMRSELGRLAPRFRNVFRSRSRLDVLSSTGRVSETCMRGPSS